MIRLLVKPTLPRGLSCVPCHPRSTDALTRSSTPPAPPDPTGDLEGTWTRIKRGSGLLGGAGLLARHAYVCFLIGLSEPLFALGRPASPHVRTLPQSPHWSAAGPRVSATERQHFLLSSLLRPPRSWVWANREASPPQRYFLGREDGFPAAHLLCQSPRCQHPFSRLTVPASSCRNSTEGHLQTTMASRWPDYSALVG